MSTHQLEYMLQHVVSGLVVDHRTYYFGINIALKNMAVLTQSEELESMVISIAENKLLMLIQSSLFKGGPTTK